MPRMDSPMEIDPAAHSASTDLPLDQAGSIGTRRLRCTGPGRTQNGGAAGAGPRVVVPGAAWWPSPLR